MNEDFILKIVSALDSKGIKADFEKIKKVLEKDPLIKQLNIDGTMAKKTAQSLAPELQKYFNNLFKETGIDGFKLSIKEVEGLLTTTFKNSQKEIDKTIAKEKELYVAHTSALEEDRKRTEANIKNQKQEYLERQKAYELNKKYNQESISLDLDRQKTSNQISTYMKENTKLTDDFIKKLREMQGELGDVDAEGLKRVRKEFATLKSDVSAQGLGGKSPLTNFISDIKNFATFLGAGSVIMGSIRTFQNMITEVKNLDASLVDLQMATGYSSEEAGKLLKTYIDLGQQMGATATEVSAAASDWLRQGKSIADTNKLIQASLVLSKVGQIESANATQYLTAITKAYGVAVEDTLSVVDKLSAVDMESATDVAGLAEAMGAVSTNARLAGVDMDTLLGYIAVIGEVTQDSMSSVGTALNAVFSRMGNIKLSRLVDPETGEDLNNVETSLKNVGISLRDSMDSFRDFDDVLNDTASRWNTYSDVEKRSIAASMAGVNHMEKFLVLMENFGKAQEYSQVSMESNGTAMEKFAIYQDSIEAKTKALTASFQELASNTVQSGWVKGFIDLLNVIVKLIDKIGVFNVALTTTFGILGAKGVMPLIPSISKSVTGLASSLGLAGNASKAFVGAASTIIPLVTALLGVGAVIALYDKFTVTLKEAQNALAESKKEYDESSSSLAEVNQKLLDAKNRITELNSLDSLSFVEKDELDKLKEATEQLLIQKDTLQEINNTKLGEVIKDTIENYTKQFGEDGFSQDQVNQFLEYASMDGNVASLGSDTNDLSQMIALYKQLEILRDKALDSDDSFEVERLNQQIKFTSESLYESIATLNEFKATLEKVPFDSLSEKQQKYLNEINNSIELIYTNIAPEKWKDIQFESVINKDEIKDTVDTLNELAKTSPITPEQISGSEKLMESLKAVGITAKEASEQFNAMNNVTGETSGKLLFGAKEIDSTAYSIHALGVEAETATGYVNHLGQNVDTKNLQTSISDARTAVQDFNNILKSMKDNGGITSGVLDTITQKYPQLLKYMGDEKEFRKQLEQAIKDQKKTAEEYYKAMLEMDNSLYNAVVKNNSERVNKLAEYYGTDITNWKSIAQAKADIDSKLLTKLNEKWAEYYAQRAKVLELEQAQLETETSDNPIFKQYQSMFGDVGLDPTSKYLKDQQNLLKQLSSEAQTAQTNYDDLKNLFVDTDYTTDLVNALSTVADTPEKTKEKTKKSFSQVFDWIAIKIEQLSKKAQKAIDDVSKYVSYIKKNNQLDIAITASVDQQKSLKSLQKSYEEAAKKVKLPKKYQDLVNNGGLNIETITNEKLANKIKEYQQWMTAAQGVADEIKNIDTQVKELNAQKLDNIIDFFDSRTGFLESEISNKESAISYKQNAGKEVTEADYKTLIDLQNKIIANTQKEIDAYSKAFNEQIKLGQITVGSKEYYEGKEKLNELTSATREARSALYDYKEEIRTLRWENFDKGITSINNIKEEMSDLSSLIKDENVLDEFGNITEDGYTKIGLLSQQMAQNNKLVSEYNVAIKTLNTELKKGIITQEQYDEELANYQKAQREAVKANQALEDSIAEIAKQRVQIAIDAINKETDAFKESIDSRKKLLDAEKNLQDYRNSINKKQASITSLQQKIAALSLSTDRKSVAERLKLEKQLKDEQDSLTQTQYDENVKQQKEALDNEYDAYKKRQDDKVSTLEKSLKDQEALVKSTLEEVFKNTSEIGASIQTLASEHGLTVTESIVTPWENATSAIEIYKSALGSIPSSSTVINTGSVGSSTSTGSISDITNAIGIGVGSSIVSSGSVSKASTSNSSSSSSTKSASSTSSSKKTLPISTVKYTGNKSTLNKDSSVVDRLKYFDYDSSSSARSTLYKYFGLSGTYSGTTAQNNSIISKMKSAGFEKGGQGKLVNSLNDEGFALMQRDEALLTASQTKDFKKIAEYFPRVSDNLSPNNYTSNPNNSVNVTYGSLINVEKVDSNNIDQMETIARQAVQQANRDLLTKINNKK